MCTHSQINDIECGRVYFNNSKANVYRIKCLLCLCEFTSWPLFDVHIRLTHNNKNGTFHLTQKSSEVNEKQYNIPVCDPEMTIPEYNQLTQTEYLKESAKEVFTAKSNVDTNCIPDQVSQPINCTNGESILNIEVEILPSFKKINKEYVRLNDPNEETMFHGSPSQTKTMNRTSRCFYQLRTTKPSVLLGFIDIIRRHPCHWDPQNIYYGKKDRREESLRQICKELKELFKICISPQLARSSILSLIRWFNREYLRSVHSNQPRTKSKRGRWSSNGYKCVHPKYFNKLIEFLPCSHLKVACCQLCQRQFKTENQLKVHKHHVHGEDSPFNCQYCKRSFLHASTWKHHENRHTKTHVWRCSVCSYVSSTKTDYKLHLVSHSDTRAFICDLCGASYKSSTSLNVHFRTHNAPKLQCSICNKKFYENYRLKRHLMIHEAEESVLQSSHNSSVSQA